MPEYYQCHSTPVPSVIPRSVPVASPDLDIVPGVQKRNANEKLDPGSLCTFGQTSSVIRNRLRVQQNDFSRTATMSDVSLDSKLFHSRASRLFENWNVRSLRISGRIAGHEAERVFASFRTPLETRTSRNSPVSTGSASSSVMPKRIPER